MTKVSALTGKRGEDGRPSMMNNDFTHKSRRSLLFNTHDRNFSDEGTKCNNSRYNYMQSSDRRGYGATNKLSIATVLQDAALFEETKS